MYYYLNKLGIAVSIHSFITSESLRLNAQAILVLWCIILFNMCSRLNLLSLISLTIIYGKAVTVDALKICTLFIALVILTKFSFFKGKLGVYHSIFLSIVIGATIINYTNIGISMTESRHTLIITTSLGTRPLTAYNIHTFIWDDN